MSYRSRASNLELAMMMGNLNPNSTTRPCTQCQAPVPKTQTLLTCEKCRDKKKRQKARRKERDTAIAEGRGMGVNQGFSSAPLQAVVARQEEETKARIAAAARSRRGDVEPSASDSASASTSAAATARSGYSGMGIVMQAILDEHEKEHSRKGAAKKPAPKKKAAPARRTVPKSAAQAALNEDEEYLAELLLQEFVAKELKLVSSAGGASKSAQAALDGDEEYLAELLLRELVAKEPASDSESASALDEDEEFLTKLLLREVVAKELASGSGSGTKRKFQEVEADESGLYDAETAKKRLRGEMPMPKLEPIPEAASTSQQTLPKSGSVKSLPLTSQSTNLPPAAKSAPGAKPQKVQANLSNWFKPTAKSV
ncbi:hypothetical protein R3P38DRAFT_2924757 [Favolaschia claudopus]|uniref:Uncharacterized protein n=1 Tax=Favolaschia claudopus TaxID=2862362 RepID=A0AAW0BXL6_9AGAR